MVGKPWRHCKYIASPSRWSSGCGPPTPPPVVPQMSAPVPPPPRLLIPKSRSSSRMRGVFVTVSKRTASASARATLAPLADLSTRRSRSRSAVAASSSACSPTPPRPRREGLDAVRRPWPSSCGCSAAPGDVPARNASRAARQCCSVAAADNARARDGTTARARNRRATASERAHRSISNGLPGAQWRRPARGGVRIAN